ncbi:MAG: tetratricopeptide repeat protein [Nitrospinae bacterium]|nr:tetratricopeptide repeat protein [Nitrospinota bacterium]
MNSIYSKISLALLIVLVYGNTIFNTFHFDDIPSILEKPWIRGLDKIPQFIFSFFQRPLVILTFNLNYSISEFEVWSYHLFNIFFHIIATLLIYKFVQQIIFFLKNHSNKSTFDLFSLPYFAALVFALHPLNTQSVTYISSRSSVLATIFYLSALILFFKGFNKRKFEGKPGRIYFLGFSLFFLLGALTKEIIVTLPAALFVFHFYFIRKESPGKWMSANVKWILLLLIPILARVGYKQFVGGGFLAASSAELSSSTWLLTQTSVVPFEYFRKLIFPFNLNLDVNFPILRDWFNPKNWFGIFSLGILIVIWMRISIGIEKKSPWEFEKRCAGFGFAWTFLTLLPTSSFIPLLDPVMEHRTYLPMVGFALIAVSTVSWACRTCNSLNQKKISGFSVQYGMLLILILFSLITIDRNKIWKDEFTLWADAKHKSPGLIRPYNNLGQAHDKLGNYDQAIEEFQQALKINPNYFFGLNNLGNIYGKQRKYEEAIPYFKKALDQKSDYSPAHYNIARAYHLIGKRQEAIEAYRKAIQYNPYFEQAFYNLAYLAMELSSFDEAIENFNKFLKMQPNHSRAHFGLGNAMMMKGQLDLAMQEYRISGKLDPTFALPYMNMANILMQTKNIPAAIENYQKALQIKPDMAAIHLSLGMIYYQFMNDAPKALGYLKESLRLSPTQPGAARIKSLIVELENKQPA